MSTSFFQALTARRAGVWRRKNDSANYPRATEGSEWGNETLNQAYSGVGQMIVRINPAERCKIIE